MKKRLALFSLLMLLLIPAGLFGLLNSDSGSRWLLQHLLARLPAQTSVKAIEGRLLERLELSDLTYKTDTETVSINKLVFAWQPASIFSRKLKIVDLTIDGLTVNITDNNAPAETSGFDINADLLLPVDIALENLLLTNASIQLGEQVHTLQKLQLSGFTEHGQLNVVSLAINAQPLAATIKGEVKLGNGFPFNITADWQFNSEEYGLLQAVTTINGDLQQLAFDNRVSSPFKLTLTGDLADLPTTPRINAHGDWQNFNWPLVGNAPQVSSQQGDFELSGLLSEYQVKLNAQLTRPSLPKAQLTFSGTGSTEAIAIDKLELKSSAGVFQLGGAVSWQEAILFDLKASAENFNPAILLPELPGSLSFSALVKGKLAGESLQVNADINHLQGRLRGQPVSANGKLALANEQLSVDALRVIVGRNKLNIDGTLGQEQARLNADIDAPALDELWPGLGGQIKGEGQLQGAWLNPAVTFHGTGKRLRFKEHSAEQLAVNVNYQPGANKSSQLKLSAGNIKSGPNQLSKVQIDGLGSPEQHRFTIDLSSHYGELSSALTGRLKGNSWEGDFSKLDLQSNDAGRWQLSNNLVVRMVQSTKGIDAKLAQTCLHQQAAMLCLNGSYLSNSDLQLQLKANDLPLSLLQAYAPEGMQVIGIINADADIQQQKGLLTGNYRLDLPATKVAFAADKKPTTIHLGASSLSGTLQGSKISADINLALAAQDYLRGQLQVDTGNTQALSGQIKASIVDLSLLNSFLPQLTGLKGKFNADLAVLGTTAAPAANGAITFTQGAADLNGLGLELRDINLQARATGNIAEDIQITGSAKSGQGNINLSGVAKLPGTIELQLTGKDFEVAKLPEAQIAVSPELKLLFADNRGKVTGTIKVPKAIMEIQQLPEQAVTVSGDEVIIGAEKTIENTATAPSIDADIEVELGKQVSFSGQGLQTNLSGKLKIMKTAEKIAMYGNVDMDKGHYTSYGQDLTVRKGRFVFNGPADQPWLDVEAIRVSKSKTVTAILSVTGPLKSPKTRLSSEPALPETDVLAYLVTGNPLNQASKSESNMIASAAVSLGAGRVSWLADQLGIDNLEVKEGETLEDTLVAVGQYLTPDFYVGTKVGLFNKQAVLVLKHKLTNTINVETETGTSQRIKLNYEFERD